MVVQPRVCARYGTSQSSSSSNYVPAIGWGWSSEVAVRSKLFLLAETDKMTFLPKLAGPC